MTDLKDMADMDWINETPKRKYGGGVLNTTMNIQIQ
jgi:hypothetical protein